MRGALSDITRVTRWLQACARCTYGTVDTKWRTMSSCGRGLAWTDHEYLRIVLRRSIIIRIGDAHPVELHVSEPTTLQQDTQYVFTDRRGRVLTSPSLLSQLQTSEPEIIPPCPAILAPQPIANGIPHVDLAQAEHLSVVLSLLRSIPISHPSPITPITTTTSVLTSPLDHAPLIHTSRPCRVLPLRFSEPDSDPEHCNIIITATSNSTGASCAAPPSPRRTNTNRVSSRTSDLPPHFRASSRRGVTRRGGTSVQGRNMINVTQVGVQGSFDGAPSRERGGPLRARLHMPHLEIALRRVCAITAPP